MVEVEIPLVAAQVPARPFVLVRRHKGLLLSVPVSCLVAKRDEEKRGER